MKKNIDTLVEDIYSLFDVDKKNNLKDLDKHLKEFTEGVTETIKNLMNEKHTPKRNLRLSAIGKPSRQLWYDKHTEHEDKKLNPSLRIKFFYGHLLEEVLILFTKLAGHKVTAQQKEVEIEGVKGHQDCFIDGVLVDCKSASGKSFLKFKNNTLSIDDPFGYIPQISAYAEGNGVNEAAFLAIDKQSGEICLTKVHSVEMINAKDRVKHLKKALDSNSPPSKCYPDVSDGMSGNRKLAIGCVYCSHKRLCWSDTNDGKGLRVFNYAKGKRFLTQVNRTPDVEEIINW